MCVFVYLFLYFYFLLCDHPYPGVCIFFLSFFFVLSLVFSFLVAVLLRSIIQIHATVAPVVYGGITSDGCCKTVGRIRRGIIRADGGHAMSTIGLFGVPIGCFK